ncbi:MAG: contractile injection system tape measure protein [Saprospiraceae bacterium]|nr:contractile injection system tape measure protein [Saprospiraceae bacterium]
MTHRIRQQILELELPREAGAVALQQRAGRVFQEQVLPRLEEVFNRIAPAGKVVRIERLELDLGDISETHWERDFVEKCVAEISRQVAETAFEVGNDELVKTCGEAENAVELLLFFLENGFLPWYGKGMQLSVLEDLLLDKLPTPNGFFRQEIRRILREKPGAMERLFRQFRAAFAENILAAALDFSAEQMGRVMEALNRDAGFSTDVAQRVLIFKQMLATSPEKRKNMPEEPLLVRQWLAETGVKTPGLPPSQKNNPPAASSAPTPVKAGKEEAPSAGRLSRKEDHQEKTPASGATAPRLPHEGLPVELAGLVLLGPYLPAFFTKAGLQPGGDPEDIESVYRAIHLLHYLATGTGRAEEPVLLLPKILLGVSPDTSVPQDAGLLEEEKQAAERLLEAVIRNWPALKNTRPGGLRSAFLQRQGWLSWEEQRGAWLLRVERLGQDVLLEKISWSYSVIKLPWMKEMLQVEW